MRRRSKALAAGAAVVGVTVGTSAPAGATTHQNQILGQGSWLAGKGSEYEPQAGIERWSSFQISENRIDITSMACDYSGFWRVANPDGSTFKTVQLGPYNRCSFAAAWIDFPSLNGDYAEDKRFTSKWRSSSATNGNWYVIGTLVD